MVAAVAAAAGKAERAARDGKLWGRAEAPGITRGGRSGATGQDLTATSRSHRAGLDWTGLVSDWTYTLPYQKSPYGISLLWHAVKVQVANFTKLLPNKIVVYRFRNGAL